MSLLSCHHFHQFDNDVLFVIFDHLDDQDLLRCEVVCHQWRNVLISGRPWRRLFHRKIISSPQWRDIVRIFRVDVEKLQTVHYRSLCRAIIEEQKQIDRNWRSGKLHKTNSTKKYFEEIDDIIVWGDRIAVYSWSEDSGETFDFLHRTSLEVISSMKIPDESFAATNTEIVVVWDKKSVKILNTNGQLISELPELDEKERISWDLTSCCITGDQIAVFSQTEGQEKLSLWDVSDPLRITRLKSQRFSLGLPFGFTASMKMDEQFIVVSTSQNTATSIHFISKITLNLHWQMSVNGCVIDNFAFGKGLLLKYDLNKNEKCGVIQVHDVTSKTYLREMRIKAMQEWEKFQHKVHFNSKFMVVVQRREHGPPSEISIYDLEAIKNPNSSADELLVHTSAVKFYCNRIVVTETEIFGERMEKIERMHFSSFEFFGKSVTLSSPWRSVWRSKGVDEEPLEPVRHMEVYKEVVKFFNELSINCQRAIKHYPVDVDLASSSLDGDFINDGQLALMKMYVDKRNETVQIHKNTQGSGTVLRIQLVDVTIGYKIDKMMKLNIDAIGCHIGGNLLVFVAEHNHLLSVWRVKQNLNLTHVKDVSIGDYDHNARDSLQVDEHFIAVSARREYASTTIDFISPKTFQVERSLSFISSCFETSFYDGGHLFLMNNDRLVRVLDVASGTFLQNIRMEPSIFDYVINIRANSNYVVIAATENEKWGGPSKLFVYDLKCLKEMDAAPTHLLLTTIELECEVNKMLMNETRIACLSDKKMYVVDLKSIDRLRCPSSC